MYIDLLGTYIPPYGLFISVGFICALFSAYLLCKFLRCDYYDFLIIAFILLASGFIGAKILYLIVNINRINLKLIFSNIQSFASFLNSGFVFYGGLIGGSISLFLIYKFLKIDIKKYEKILVPSIVIAHAFGRIGCAFAGCCYGKPTEGFLYVQYSSSSYAPTGIKLVPVQAIESSFLFLLFFCIVLLIIKRIKIRFTLFYLLLYSIFRFVIEFFRNDFLRGNICFLSTSQFISILIFIGTIIYLIFDYFSFHKNDRCSL